MRKVKIFGAGSIGNHLAHACRSKGWDVLICDLDGAALKRTKEDIYPGRYGSWDDGIKLALAHDAPTGGFDLVIIGTPPDSHMKIALAALEREEPKAILIEKPLCTPSLEGAQELYEKALPSGAQVCVGYNHTLCKNTLEAEILIKEGAIGDCVTIYAGFLEHWGGIFGAHPWLAGPEDSYLGFSSRGGGASGEHSHAVNIWQHFARTIGAGRIVETLAFMDYVDDGKVAYDRMCNFNVRTEKGMSGLIQQDVVTRPAIKTVRIQGSDGAIEWRVNIDAGHDAVFLRKDGDSREKMIPKNRPGDFKWEVDHLEKIMDGAVDESPISLERGLDTMMVVAAAHLSRREGRPVRINYDSYTQDSLIPS